MELQVVSHPGFLFNFSKFAVSCVSPSYIVLYPFGLYEHVLPSTCKILYFMRCNIIYTEFLDARKLLFSLKEKMSRRCHNREKANPQKTKLGGKGKKKYKFLLPLNLFSGKYFLIIERSVKVTTPFVPHLLL